MVSQLLLHAICSQIQYGGFVIRYPNGRHKVYGYLGAQPHPLVVHINTPRAVQALLTNPSLGLGDCFTSGEIYIEPERLPEFFDIVLGNIDAIDRLRHRLRFFNSYTPSNRRDAQENNVQAHYDLPDEYYRLFLGEAMQYSCGFFRDPAESLDAAQQYKIDVTLAKAAIRPGDRVLDVGCGWGSLAFEAAERGAEVIGITLSQTQYDYARKKVEDRGIASGSGGVRIIKLNYQEPALRALKPFDTVVSVGMFEHVGIGDQALFFDVMKQLLVPGGRLVLHTITKPAPAPADQWIARRIFPGGHVPVVSNIAAQAAEAGFHLVHFEDFYESYVTTLERWFEAHLAHRDEIIRIATPLGARTGLSGEAFWRQRLMYLMASCKAFEHGGLGLGQFVFRNGKPPLGELQGHPSQDLMKSLEPNQPEAVASLH